MSNSVSSIISKLEYAANLQKAFLPKERHFDRIFKDSFHLFLPAEYLSGDFYWVAQKGNIKYAAIGDCTGHGVSAAFLSMLGYNYLNHAVHNKGLRNLNDILMELDKLFIEAFTSNNEELFDNDWIDMAIISYNTETKDLKFAGANRKVLVFYDDKCKMLKGSRYPIGGWQIEKDRDFPVQTMNVNKATIYLGSDGFQDQFGPNFSKKIGSKKLHNLLKTINHKSMSQQKDHLLEYFYKWKGDNEQTDDICVIGIEI